MNPSVFFNLLVMAAFIFDLGPKLLEQRNIGKRLKAIRAKLDENPKRKELLRLDKDLTELKNELDNRKAPIFTYAVLGMMSIYLVTGWF